MLTQGDTGRFGGSATALAHDDAVRVAVVDVVCRGVQRDPHESLQWGDHGLPWIALVRGHHGAHERDPCACISLCLIHQRLSIATAGRYAEGHNDCSAAPRSGGRQTPSASVLA